MFLINSRLGLFSAALRFHKELPFSLSYGVILPSSLTRVFSRVLVFSTYLPVSVYGTGSKQINPRSFSRKFEIIILYLLILFLNAIRICLYCSVVFSAPIHLGADVILLCHSISLFTSSGISTWYTSATLFSLTLVSDLPRADEPSPGNLRFLTDRILTYLFVTYTGILTSKRSNSPHGLSSSHLERSPTTWKHVSNPQFRYYV